jgi:hypothetical protein
MMLILKLILLFSAGLFIGFCLKKVSFLLFIVMLAVLASAVWLIGFLIFLLLFSTVSFQNMQTVINSGVFCFGVYIGYARTEFKWPN